MKLHWEASFSPERHSSLYCFDCLNALVPEGAENRLGLLTVSSSSYMMTVGNAAGTRWASSCLASLPILPPQRMPSESLCVVGTQICGTSL